MKSQLLQSLFDEEERRPLTVSEVNSQVKRALEKAFASVWIEAEIVNFVAASSGHWYFTLHDGFTQLKAACYRGSNWKIKFQPFDGLQIRVRGRLSLYEPKGEYQMLVESLEPIGEGALKVAFEQIKLKLAKERLFDEEYKRPLPMLPKRVGVVTSPNGAAFHDILHVLSRRTRTVSIVLIPTRVQGEMAGEEIRQAILNANEFNENAAEKDKIDVLIVGRGGGSSEDLWAFNEERLARTIRASLIPIISAVGHEIDFTIADFVADRRAPTPSAAAEIVAESEDQIEAFISQQTQDLFQLIEYKILRLHTNLQELTLSPVFTEFPQRIKDWKYEIEDYESRMEDAFAQKLKEGNRRLEKLISQLSPLRLASKVSGGKIKLALLQQRQISAIKKTVDKRDESLKIEMASLDALSPLSVLKRGFSITENERGLILRDAGKVKIDETVKIRLAKGKIEARVTKTEK
ncbi:MAG: exodeoxyribonuclease VII large subunit [Acidobacteriota bacterium]|nr:exodeoxyribonuclease VII large subunit [Acidobacteriota bacterium]